MTSFAVRKSLISIAEVDFSEISQFELSRSAHLDLEKGNCVAILVRKNGILRGWRLVFQVRLKRFRRNALLNGSFFDEGLFSEKKRAPIVRLPDAQADGQKLRFLGPLLLYKHPTIPALAIFLLILSGPPRFRMRDPEASLRGDIDWVVALHLAVWGLAGLWVLWQFARRFQSKRPLLQLRLPHVLALAMIVVLAASAGVSDAPVLTAFKVYQMLVLLLFTQIFIERFGVWTSLKAMLWGYALLCAAIALCAVFIPGEGWTYSEFAPDPSRLFGGSIAATPPDIVSPFLG